jgi:hypothetical protein
MPIFSDVQIETVSDHQTGEYHGETTHHRFYIDGDIVAYALTEFWHDVDWVFVRDIQAGQYQKRKGYATQALLWIYDEYSKPILPVHITPRAVKFWQSIRLLHPHGYTHGYRGRVLPFANGSKPQTTVSQPSLRTFSYHWAAPSLQHR